jgi:hypothetical protein
MLENIQNSLKYHYAITESTYYYIKNFEKELTKLESSLESNSKYLNDLIESLLNQTCDHINSTNELVTKISQIIVDNQLDASVSDSLESDPILSSNEISQLKRGKLIITPRDQITLKDSFKEFLDSYKFNVLLIYLLSLEFIIRETHKRIKLNISSNSNNKIYLNKLEKILLMAILYYLRLINDFNLIIENKILQLEIPSNFPNPFNEKAERCYCDHINKKTNSFSLLFSNITIKYNLYTTSELNVFCKSNCKSLN